MGPGTDAGDEYFCSLKVHRLMTQIQRRTVLLFDIATKSEVNRFLNVLSDVFIMTFMILQNLDICATIFIQRET